VEHPHVAVDGVICNRPPIPIEGVHVTTRDMSQDSPYWPAV